MACHDTSRSVRRAVKVRAVWRMHYAANEREFERNEVENVHAVVVGCGRVGSAVATRLVSEGWSVSVIDEAAEAFNRLGPEFPGETYEGHALDNDVLRAAGIERADACVVATNGDNTNLVTAQTVKLKL